MGGYISYRDEGFNVVKDSKVISSGARSSLGSPVIPFITR